MGGTTLVWMLLIGFVSAFNLDTRNWISFVAPTDANPTESHFGFSLALLKNRVWIGAPHYETRGAIFTCQYDSQALGGIHVPCDQKITIGLEKNVTTHFFGAAMTLSSQGKLIACAPYFWKDTAQRSCRQQVQIDAELENYYDSKQVSHFGKAYGIMYAMVHALLMTEDDNLVMGYPTAKDPKYQWHQLGTVLHIQTRPFHKPSLTLAPWSWHNRPAVLDRQAQVGASIVRGHFSHDGHANHYVVGAPRGADGKGAVFLCLKCFSNNINRKEAFHKFSMNSFDLDGTQVGSQVGSRFGHSLCAVDINGDGFDDLVVGAPLFTPRKGVGEGGNVYVFKTNVIGFRTNLILMSQNLQHAEEAGARFGATLASLGDLDGDRLGDFAVGAPFENQGAGAVYIYRGSRNFDLGEPSQKITPEDFPQLSMPTFGFSMTVKDVDGNNRPDVMIGSQGSRHVVLLRAFEVERITPRSAFSIPRKVKPESNGFVVKVMARLTFPNRSRWTAHVWLSFGDKRIKIQTNNVTLNFERNQAEKVAELSVEAAMPKFGMDENILPRPISFDAKISWSLTNPAKSNFFNNPITDPKNDLMETLPIVVSLQTGCINLDSCKCSLSLQGDTSSKDMFVGQNHTLSISLQITNHGEEPAYSIVLEIQSESPIPIPTHWTCQNVTDSGYSWRSAEGLSRGIYYLYECDLPIAIQALGSKDLAVAFDIKDWTKFVQFEAIVVKTRLRGKCDPVSQGSGHQLSQVLVSKLNFRYNIIIESSTSVIQTQFEYTNTTIHFIHLYTLANVGPSPTNETFTFNVYTPSNDVLGVHLISHGFKCKAIESSLVTGIHPDYSLATKAMSCQQDSCLIFQCTIEPGFKKGGAVNVVIDMNFQAEKAMLLYPNTYHIVVHTAIRRLGSSNSADFATFFSEFYPVNVSTLAQMAKSYWPYIVGATLGILLLSLTFVAFWKLGLFSKTRLFKRQMDKAELIRPRLPDSSDGGLSD